MEILIIIAALAALLIFTMSRSRKQERAATQFRESLTPGTEVMTSAGMIGTVVSIDAERQIVCLESSDGHITDWVMPAVKNVPAQFALPSQDNTDDTDSQSITEAQSSSSTIGPEDIDVPNDLSGLETPDDETQGRKRPEDGEER